MSPDLPGKKKHNRCPKKLKGNHGKKKPFGTGFVGKL
jgi:hypothetical protein